MNERREAGNGLLKELLSSSDSSLAREILKKLDKDEIIDLLLKSKAADELKIPVSIFTEDLSVFESAVLFLVDYRNMRNVDAAGKLNKSQQCIWVTHRNAKKKHPGGLKIEDSPYDIPLSVLGEKKISVLESVVAYLKDSHGLKFSEIAKILSRDQRTVWTVYKRANEKR